MIVVKPLLVGILSNRMTVMHWKALAVSLGAILFAGSLYGMPASAASTTSSEVAAIQQSWSYVPAYSSAPEIEAGRVLDRSGHPVSGATVVLFPLMYRPAKGTVVPAVSRTITDAAGRYMLHLPSDLRSSLANKHTGGALNLHIIAFYPGGQGDWFVPVTHYYLGGGTGTTGAPAVAAGHCVTTAGLTGVVIDNQQQETFSLGANVTALGSGINLSSQDGYTNDASLTYSFASGDYPPECGVNGFPGQVASDYIQIHK